MRCFEQVFGLVSLVAVFALTGPAGAYDFGTGAEAVAMVKRTLGEVASRGILSNKTGLGIEDRRHRMKRSGGPCGRSCRCP